MAWLRLPHRVNCGPALMPIVWRSGFLQGGKGGLLLGQVRRDTAPLVAAMDVLIEQLCSLGIR
jgi:hypothetical protein